MAFPTVVNNQITDAVTQSNVKVVGEAPAMAIGSIYQTMAHSSGILFENAVSAQQQDALARAASNQGVMQLYGMAQAGAPTAGILARRDPAELEALIRQLKSE